MFLVDFIAAFFRRITSYVQTTIYRSAGCRPETGPRPDLAHRDLAKVAQPTLLIVGGDAVPVIGMNKEALAQISVEESKLKIVPGAGHLFQEPEKLERVAELARDWFQAYLIRDRGDMAL